jgi:hypothetical protein
MVELVGCLRDQQGKERLGRAGSGYGPFARPVGLAPCGWPEAGERLRAPLVRRVVRFCVPGGLRRVRLSVGWARGREGEEQAGEGGVEEKLALQSLWFPVFLSTPSHVVGFSSHS